MKEFNNIISTIFISILFYTLYKNFYIKTERKRPKIILESNTYNNKNNEIRKNDEM